MNRQHFYLTNPFTHSHAEQEIFDAPNNAICETRSRTHSLLGSEKLHSMFSDIARQVEFSGKECNTETVKHLLVDRFARIKAADGELLPGYDSNVPSLIGNDFVHLGIQMRRFTTAQMAEFITYLYAWGVDHGVQFADAFAAPDWYRNRRKA